MNTATDVGGKLIAPIISANVRSMYLVIIDVLVLGRQFTKKMRL